ncbi:hypothetical protein ACFX1W_014033 [Malus domestica]
MGLLSPSSRVLLAPHSWSSSFLVLLAGSSRSSCSSSSVLVTPTGVLAGDAHVALSVGVDGHDLRVAGMGDVLGEAFFVTEGFAFSFLGFADDISAFLSSRIRCMAINYASFSARFLEFSPRSFSSLFSLLWS